MIKKVSVGICLTNFLFKSGIFHFMVFFFYKSSLLLSLLSLLSFLSVLSLLSFFYYHFYHFYHCLYNQNCCCCCCDDVIIIIILIINFIILKLNIVIIATIVSIFNVIRLDIFLSFYH